MRYDYNGFPIRFVIGLLVMLSISFSSAHIGVAQAQGEVIAQLPDKDHGVFRPSTHGFTLTNEALSKQIVQWFKLKGEDEDISEEEKAFLLWELFDPDNICIWSQDGEACTLKPAAIKWVDSQIKSMENGMCEGMIVASLALWKARQDREELLRESLVDFGVDVDNHARLLAGDQETLVGDVVTYGFASQLVDSVARQAEASRKEPPAALFEKIYNSIASYQNGSRGPDAELYTVGMYRVEKGALKDGHSVMPYAVTDEGNGVYRVYVYDANHPRNDALYVEFQGNRWMYGPQKLTYDTEKSLELTPWVVRNFHKDGYFECPYCAPQNPLQAPTEVWLTGEGDLTISNTAGIIIAGFDSNKGQYVESPTVSQTPFKGGLDEDVPDLYQLPASGAGYWVTAWDPFKVSEARETVDLVLSNAGIYIVMADLDLARYPLTVSVKNTPAGPLLWIDGGQTGASIPSVVLVEDGDKASYEFELSDVQVPPGTGLAIGLAKGHHRLIFSPTSIGSGTSAVLRPYHLVAARVDNQLNEYVLEVPEVLVGNQETVVFDFGNWDFVDSEVSAEDLPITLWEGVIIEDVLAASAAAFPGGGQKLSATRVTKNNKALKRSRQKTTKVKRPRRRPSS